MDASRIGSTANFCKWACDNLSVGHCKKKTFFPIIAKAAELYGCLAEAAQWTIYNQISTMSCKI